MVFFSLYRFVAFTRSNMIHRNRNCSPGKIMNLYYTILYSSILNYLFKLKSDIMLEKQFQPEISNRKSVIY